MSDSPRLIIPYVSPGQAGHVPHNEAINLIEALLARGVISRDESTPPVGTSGDAYIVAEGGTGDWLDHDDHIAVWHGTDWVFIIPVEGVVMYVEDENSTIVFDGTAWIGCDPGNFDFYKHVGSTDDRYYLGGCNSGHSLSTAALTVGTLYAVPFVHGGGGIIDRIAFAVTTGGSAGSVARVGIYKSISRTNLYPGDRVLDGGEQSTTSTGLKSATVDQKLIPGHLYWLVYLAGVAAPTVRIINPGGGPQILGIDNTFAATGIGLGWSVAFSYAALPATFPAGGTIATQASAHPAIGVRFES